MTTLRFLLVLLLASAFAVASAIPAEDISDTAYDESEEVPYEKASTFSSEVLSQYDRTTWSESAYASRAGSRFDIEDRENPPQSDWPSAHIVPVSLLLLDHELRR